MGQKAVKALPLILVLTLLCLAWGLGLHRLVGEDTWMALLGTLGPWMGPAFVLLMVVSIVLALPSTPIIIASGLLFGPMLGFGLAWLAGLIGVSLTYLIAKTALRGWLASKMPPKLRALDEKLATQGFKVMLMLRLVPVMPYSGLNYGSGLTRIRYRDYILATAIGMAPGMVLYTFFGSWVASGAWKTLWPLSLIA